jgi:hypothetical protein
MDCLHFYFFCFLINILCRINGGNLGLMAQFSWTDEARIRKPINAKDVHVLDV